MVLGVAFACGMASTFKYIADDFPDNMGAVSGIVGMAGGLGGFLLPIMFGAILDRLGVNSSCFMLLYGIIWVSLILNYLTEVRRAPIMGEPAQHLAALGSR
jgi:NNP family nitrate/nitrite transporter-like MFS transporter